MFLGILFTILWASGAVSVKFGLLSAPPLIMGTIRFLLAGGLLLLYIYFFKKGTYRMPHKKEWKTLILLGLFNTSLYLGCGFWALQTVSSGFFNLAVVINPFLVALLSSILMKRSIQKKEWIGMIFSTIGLIIATYPLLEHSHSTWSGLLLLIIGMVSMAIGSVYFQKQKLELPSLVINAWQVLFGGVILILPSIILEFNKPFILDLNLIMYLVWSVLGVSIFAMILWFYLLKQDAVKANIWLFLTPIAGYFLSSTLLGEEVTIYDILASLFVFTGLYLSGNFRLNKAPKSSLEKKLES
ncbi:DMT family transporter [Priestia megaterium]|uniref:DMT family transporter n=1 Tax=Priestia megaterium TaxID=1404 RepID=UPI002452EDBC|nr:EamA family transporter [Priestia megaterium]MDH3144305.1 EamA family transporter [Priestia megaterium]MED4241010.1 EamA family transporter [Priestia megaterium]MED4255885.1 EamA family transporter [Priestia megaterium]MED4267739.1 EamA family transporter [Priestia megaterium]MED4278355.1 EamA family transporter [Priestia megaterium]